MDFDLTLKRQDNMVGGLADWHIYAGGLKVGRVYEARISHKGDHLLWFFQLQFRPDRVQRQGSASTTEEFKRDFRSAMAVWLDWADEVIREEAGSQRAANVMALLAKIRSDPGQPHDFCGGVKKPEAS